MAYPYSDYATTIIGPPGTVPVRADLLRRGFTNPEIGWDASTQQVLLRGKPLLRPTSTVQDRSFASPDAIEQALSQFGYTEGQSNTSKMQDLLKRLETRINQGFSYEPQDDPRYKAALERAGQTIDEGTTRVVQNLSNRNIANSTIASDQAQQLKNLALGQIETDIVPSLYESAYQEHQQGLQNILSLLGAYGSTEEMTLNTALSEAGLTGYYGGQRTLAGQTQDRAVQDQALAAAIARTNAAGAVSTQEDAEILGVPMGTSSYAAQEAAAQRRNALQIAETQLNASSANARIDTLMEVWRATGVAPAGLSEYGISEGAPYTGSLADQLENVQIQDLLDQMTEEKRLDEETLRLQEQYGLAEPVAQFLAQILDNPTKEAALANLELTKEELKKAIGSTNIDVFYNAIDDKWPGGATSAGTTEATSGLLPVAQTYQTLGTAGFLNALAWLRMLMGRNVGR